MADAALAGRKRHDLGVILAIFLGIPPTEFAVSRYGKYDGAYANDIDGVRTALMETGANYVI
ncbi:hypothetical protein GCM10011410_07450 [Hoyosella rhizosphaerae]|uniref:Uncharacterized protein n=1 Tax=Hoyosella rhizosphaerae TaxID=1755582 RepID=A0A916U1R1_9ACTN|nr:hypothetical protein GCM10011410_07450 [Hoyosella rhizosphaerae]